MSKIQWRDSDEKRWLTEVSSPEVEAAWSKLEEANDRLVDLDRARKSLERSVESFASGTEAHIIAKARLKKLNEKIKEVAAQHRKADAAYEAAIKEGFRKYKAEQERVSRN